MYPTMADADFDELISVIERGGAEAFERVQQLLRKRPELAKSTADRHGLLPLHQAVSAN